MESASEFFAQKRLFKFQISNWTLCLTITPCVVLHSFQLLCYLLFIFSSKIAEKLTLSIVLQYGPKKACSIMSFSCCYLRKIRARFLNLISSKTQM